MAKKVFERGPNPSLANAPLFWLVVIGLIIAMPLVTIIGWWFRMN